MSRIKPIIPNDANTSGVDRNALIMRTAAHNSGRDAKHQGIASIPVYDEGGDVDVNDGKHQVAILQEGEKVLTPEEAQEYDAKNEGMRPLGAEKKAAEDKVANPGVQAIKADSTETAVADNSTLPIATPEERAAVKADQQNAMGKGVNGLVQLGVANTHAKQLGLKPIDVGEAPVTSQDSTQKQIPTPLIAPHEQRQVEAGGPLTTDQGPTSETKREQNDLAGMERKAKLADYDKRIQAARDNGDQYTADRLSLAKQEYQKANPWGTASNHPGFWGKAGHIASEVGNIAGNIINPNVMSLIPGTALNKQLKEQGTFKRISTDVANDEKLNKPASSDTYKEATQGGLVDPKHPELGPQQAYVNEKDPTKIIYAGPMPAKAGVATANTDQVEDYKQRIANSGLTGKALEVYGTVPKGATAAELDKRFDEATKLRGMDQKDAETAIQNQARADAAAEHKFEHEQARQDKAASKYFTYTDDKGVTRVVTGDKLEDLPEGTQTIPVKDLQAMVGEGRSMNAVQDSINDLRKDLDTNPEVFDNDRARSIVQTTTEQMNRASAGLLIAGTGGSVPIPSGFGDAINTALQNHALDAKTARAVKNYIADYKAMKDKTLVIQMAMQNGKMGKGSQQAFESIVNQMPGGSTPDNETAVRQMNALQKTTTTLMKKYPDSYDNYTKSKPYESKSTKSEGGTADSLTVQTPAGPFTFKTQADADAFRKKAGL